MLCTKFLFSSFEATFLPAMALKVLIQQSIYDFSNNVCPQIDSTEQYFSSLKLRAAKMTQNGYRGGLICARFHVINDANDPQQHQYSWSRSSNRVKGDVKIGSMQSSPLSCRIGDDSKSFSVQQRALPTLKSTCKTLDNQLHRASKNDISGHTRKVFLQHKQKKPCQLIA